MKSSKRVTLVSFILIGGTAYFGYWSTNQFDRVFDNLSLSYLANSNSVYSFLASTSPKIDKMSAKNSKE